MKKVRSLIDKKKSRQIAETQYYRWELGGLIRAPFLQNGGNGLPQDVDVKP